MTPLQARDEILSAFWLAWKAGAAAAAGQSRMPTVQWEDQEPKAPEPSERAWARITVRHGPRAQRGMGDGTRRYEAHGIVIVQCFGPRDAKGYGVAMALATLAKDAFEGKATPGGVWFRGATVSEVGPDKGWMQANATAEFTYDETR